MPSGSLRHALRRCALAVVAVVFAATAAGRPFVAMAVQGSSQAAGQQQDCAGHHRAPSHSGMPGGECGSCCGPTCEGCALPLLEPAALAAPAAGVVALRPALPQVGALPRSRAQLRLPLPIGPPTAPVA